MTAKSCVISSYWKLSTGGTGKIVSLSNFLENKSHSNLFVSSLGYNFCYALNHRIYEQILGHLLSIFRFSFMTGFNKQYTIDCSYAQNLLTMHLTRYYQDLLEKMFKTSLIIFILFKSIFPDVDDMMTIVRHSVNMF